VSSDDIIFLLEFLDSPFRGNTEKIAAILKKVAIHVAHPSKKPVPTDLFQLKPIVKS